MIQSTRISRKNLLGKLLNKTEPWQLFLWMQMAASWVLLTVYPAIMQRLTKSLLISVLTPVLAYIILGKYLFQFKTDLYWGYAWSTILGVPLVCILFSKKWDIKSWYFFLATCFIISASNVLRTQMALPITLLVFILLITKLLVLKPKKTAHESENTQTAYSSKIKNLLKCNAQLFLALIILFASQGLLAKTIPDIFLPHFIGEKNPGFAAGPWHSAYIGLGFKENKYGIIYKDGCAMSKVQELAPGTKYLSEKYMNVLKAEYFRILKEDPAFFINVYKAKFVTIINMCYTNFEKRNGVSFTIILSLLFVITCMTRSKSKRYSFFNRLPNPLQTPATLMLPASLFCIFGGMITPMIAIPRKSYLIGSYAACDLLAFTIAVLTILFIVTTFEQKLKIRQ